MFQSGLAFPQQARGWQQLEMGWLLEDNRLALNFIDRLGAPESGRWLSPRCGPTEPRR